MLAKQIVDYDGIHVIDAGHAAASVAEKMLVIAACRMRDQGCTAAVSYTHLDVYKRQGQSRSEAVRTVLVA